MLDLAMMLLAEASILPPSVDAKEQEAAEAAQPMGKEKLAQVGEIA